MQNSKTFIPIASQTYKIIKSQNNFINEYFFRSKFFWLSVRFDIVVVNYLFQTLFGTQMFQITNDIQV